MSKTYDSHDYDRVIVEKSALKVFDYVFLGEPEEDAITRGNNFYKEEYALIERHLKKYGGDYWEKRLEEVSQKVAAGCTVMDYVTYSRRRKEYLLAGEPVEIEKKTYEEAFDALPPLYWTRHGRMEMFCMSEKYEGTITNQYAHDLLTDRYYMKLVDAADKSTWLCELLKTVS